MYVSIDQDGTLSLNDIDNMRGFSIVEAVDATGKATAAIALESISTPAEENHYWLDIESVMILSARRKDPRWVEDFWDMLKKSEPYGYVNLQLNQVKAHVETR